MCSNIKLEIERHTPSHIHTLDLVSSFSISKLTKVCNICSIIEIQCYIVGAYQHSILIAKDVCFYEIYPLFNSSYLGLCSSFKGLKWIIKYTVLESQRSEILKLSLEEREVGIS